MKQDNAFGAETAQLKEQEKQFLRYFSIFPSDEIAFSDLMQYFAIEDNAHALAADTLNTLAEKEWLIKSDNGYKVNTENQPLARTQLKPDSKNCAPLIKSLADLLEASVDIEYIADEKMAHLPLATAILEHIPDQNIEMANLAGNAAHVLDMGKGDYNSAAIHAERALNIRQNILKLQDLDLAKLHAITGTIYIHLAQLDKAKEQNDAAIKIFNNPLYSKIDLVYALAEHNMGTIYNKLGDPNKAKGYFQTELDIYKKIEPLNAKQITIATASLAGAFIENGEFLEAIDALKEACRVESNGQDRVSSFAFINNYFGLAYLETGSLDEALEHFQAAKPIREKIDPNHPDLASSHNNLGRVYLAKKEYEQALTHFDESLRIRTVSLKKHHPHFSFSYNGIGQTLFAKGEHKEALKYHRWALANQNRTLPKGHPRFAITYTHIADVLRGMGETTRALGFLQKASEIQERTLRQEHPYTARTQAAIALIASQQRD